MKNYKYILLDWDDNLAQTLGLWLDVFKQVLAEEGFNPTNEEIAASFGKVVDYFASLGIKDPLGLYEKADEIGRAKLPDAELYPDVLEVLAYFKEIGKKTALISASNRANIEPSLDKYGMRNLFDVVITREDTTKQKPDPESLFTALKALGGNADQAILIGDSDKDLGAAQNAGMDSILFYPPEHAKFYDIDKLKLLKPTFVVDGFTEIMSIVQRT